MEQVELFGKTVAYVLIKTEKGAANDVASAVSEFDGVYWASVITGPYDVIAAVCVDDNAQLGEVVIKEIQQVPGVSNKTLLLRLIFPVVISTVEPGALTVEVLECVRCPKSVLLPTFMFPTKTKLGICDCLSSVECFM